MGRLEKKLSKLEKKLAQAVKQFARSEPEAEQQASLLLLQLSHSEQLRLLARVQHYQQKLVKLKHKVREKEFKAALQKTQSLTIPNAAASPVSTPNSSSADAATTRSAEHSQRLAARFVKSRAIDLSKVLGYSAPPPTQQRQLSRNSSTSQDESGPKHHNSRATGSSDRSGLAESSEYDDEEDSGSERSEDSSDGSGSGSGDESGSDESDDSDQSELNEEAVEAIQQWQIKANEIKVDKTKCLGKGSFGEVYVGTCRGTPVAVKILNQVVVDVLDDFKHEVRVISKLRHNNILLFLGVCTEQGKLQLVTELAKNGSVHDLLRQQKKLREAQASQQSAMNSSTGGAGIILSLRRKLLILKQAALGIRWLHQSGILHLDIKPANLLLDENFECKVADFGLSQVKDKILFSGGTQNYMSPEVLLRDDFDEKTDVFSFALTMWEMFHEENAPFHGEVEGRDSFTQAVAHEGRRPAIPAHTPPLVANLIRKCWVSRAEDRPSMNMIVDSNVFDHCIIQTLLGEKDPRAAEFWVTAFFGQYEVKWPKFVRALWPFCGRQWIEGKSEREGVYLAVSLSFMDSAVVTIEQFARVIETYGPLMAVRPPLRESATPATHIPRSMPPSSLLERCFEYWSMPGFFGDISVREAEQYLTAGVKKGLYLIRFSADGSLAVATCRSLTGSGSSTSLIASGTQPPTPLEAPSFIHFKISAKQEEKCFEFNNACFTSLEALVSNSLGKICRTALENRFESMIQVTLFSGGKNNAYLYTTTT